MKQNALVYALFAASAALLTAQQASQPSPYTGTSSPPPDTSIVTDDSAQDSSGKPPAGVTGYEQPTPIPAAKPSPAHMAPQSAPAASQRSAAQPSATKSAPPDAYAADPADGTDDGIVVVAPNAPAVPVLNERDGQRNAQLDSQPDSQFNSASGDPDGDIVHPESEPQGGLGYGATIRVRLLDTLSTATSETGERFRTRVASDVIQDGQVLIPAGSEIDGIVAGVSDGHAFGRGSMYLRPETVILPNGSRFRIFAELSGAPGSTVRINGEGSVSAGSQLKKDGIEYGGAIGTGAVTGAILAGPGGALAGTIVGAGVITVHLLVSHPQATLDSGTVLLFTLNRPLDLVPAAQPGS